MKILAVDYGQKSVGLALGQRGSELTLPLPVLRRTSDRELVGRIGEVAAEFAVGEIVVGYPLNADGSESPLCRQIDRFMAALGRRLSLPVRRAPEHLSSWEADQELQARRVKPGRRKHLADSLAAEAILRTYLSR